MLELKELTVGQTYSFIIQKQSGFVQQHSQVLHCMSDPNPFPPQPVFMLGIAPTQVQNLAFVLVNFRRFAQASLQPALVPYRGISSLQHADRITQLSVNCRPDEGEPKPTVHDISTDVK